MAQIQDGTGSGVLAKVNSENQLFTRSVSDGPLEDASEKGRAAYFYSTYSPSTGDEIISIKNTESTEELHITRIIYSCTVATTFTLFEVTSGTAAGSTLTYQNPNLNSGTAKSNTSFGNASVTGSLAGNNLITTRLAADSSFELFIEGSLVLLNGDEVAITATTSGSPIIYITIIGFWDSPR